MTLTAKLQAVPASSSEAVGEIVTEARIDALNRCLAEHGVEASQIIAVLRLPAQPIANASPARYRVLYRKS